MSHQLIFDCVGVGEEVSMHDFFSSKPLFDIF